jgi:POT family proton-dependent oligopeptide transporter
MPSEYSQRMLLGHPVALYTLFFAEMWERFSYYGMRALLVFYMIKGFLGYNDHRAYAIYGAYTALVYATPFIGGMLADRLLGARRAVIIGGILMASGHLMMTVEQELAFFAALALIICGNGFFKPNISAIVGTLYDEKKEKRDGGFTIFYMGINLGAAMSPLICGYLGETFGWNYGFGLATIGMLIGVAIFAAPIRLTQVLILGCALITSVTMLFLQNNPYQLLVNAFVAAALIASGIVAFLALGRGGLPKEAGAPKRPQALKENLWGILRKDLAVYLGIAISLPLLMLLIRKNEIAGWMLALFGLAAFLWLFIEALRATKVECHRLFVALILMFFSMLFWSFFEQSGSSINNFTDRNIDRVFEQTRITKDQVGETIKLKLTQEQLGYLNGQEMMNLTKLTEAREENRDTVDWHVSQENVGMGVGGAEIPASIFQAANPVFILIFGLVFTGLWAFLAARHIDPSIPVKFSLGLFQLGLGFLALWHGASTADPRGMVSIFWLLIGYLLHTTGELCLSPVGLSMVIKLSPARMVSTVMGAWFLATGFSSYLAGIIASFTGVSHGGDEGQIIPPPIDTVDIYGDIFGKIALTAIASALICFILSPLLKKWMHEETDDGS